MKKKFLLMIVFMFSTILCCDIVFAANKLDCDYGDYRIVINTNIYNKTSDYIDERSSGVDVYIKGEKFIRDLGLGTEIILYHGKKSYDYKEKIQTCPTTIYLWTYEQQNGGIVLYVHTYDPVTSGEVATGSDISKLVLKASCGDGAGKFTGIPYKIPELTSFAFTVIQVAVPVILVLMGSIDFFKSITSGKEDEMKKGQKMFIKRLIVGIVIFLVVVIVKFFISVVADTNVSNMVDCIDCFISNDCN